MYFKSKCSFFCPNSDSIGFENILKGGYTIMTESKIYADNFKCSFRNSDQFLDFLKERKEKSLWMKAPSNSLQFKPLEKDSELGNLYMQLYQSNGSAEILVDTMENTSLLLSVN